MTMAWRCKALPQSVMNLNFFYLCCLLVMVLHLAAASAGSVPSLSSSGSSTLLPSSPQVNTSLCPGITLSGCSDDECIAFDAGDCPSSCVYSTTAQRCTGIRSCLLNACSGHGLCQLADASSSPSSSSSASSTHTTGAARCECAADYYGDDCSVHCSAAECAAGYSVAGLTCSVAGACSCPGRFTGITQGCSACEDGWYGVLCDTQCPCSGHGSCDRATGVCLCYADATLGFWDGATCDVCAPAYRGANCTQSNTLFTALPKAVMEAAFSETTTDLSEPLTLQWVSHQQLVLSKGAAVLCGYINVTDASGDGGQQTRLLPAQDVYMAPRVVRSSVIFGNGTVALLAAGGRLLGGEASSSGSRDASLGATVLHCAIDAGAHNCTFTVVADITFTEAALGLSEDKKDSESGDDGTAAVTVVDATISEVWGWAAVLSNGALVLQHHPDASLYLPTGFAARSMHVDPATGLLLVAGDKADDEWAIYATQTSSNATIGVVALSFTNGSSDAALERAGKAWAVNVSGGAILVAGTSAGAAWVLVGHITLASDPSSIAVSVLETSSLAVVGTPRTFSFYTAGALSSMSLLCVVQTTEEARLLAWTRDRTEDDLLMLTPRTTQDITATIDVLHDLHTQYVRTNGLLVLFQTSGSGVVLRPYTGYGVTSISPTVSAPVGWTTVIVDGLFFTEHMDCDFSGERTSATNIGSTYLQCFSPLYYGDAMCTPVSVEVVNTYSVVDAVTDNHVLQRRVHTPTLNAAFGKDSNGPYTSTSSLLPIMVYGQGFVNTSALCCRFTDVESIRIFPARYVSSRHVECAFPPNFITSISSGTGSIDVSLDGSVFSSSLPFEFIGEAARLEAAASANHVKVKSGAYVALPLIDIRVVDEGGNALRDLDRNATTGVAIERVVTLSAPWVNSTRMEVEGPIDPASSLVVLAFSNKTVAGVTSFSVFLQYPLVGIGGLVFSSEGLESATVVYTVEEGNPYRLEVAVQPATELSSHSLEAGRQPVIVVRDISGNIIGNVNELSRLTSGYVTAVYFDGVAWTSQRSLKVGPAGYFNFTQVAPRALFGHPYQMIFMSTGFSNISSAVMTASPCYADEYGRYGTTSCLPCPAHAVCNGSYVFEVTDGYWKGGDVAYDIYACPRPRVCRAGQCTAGYTGVVCGVCASGYGRTGSQCVACFSLAVNVVLVVLLAIFILAIPLFLAIVAFQALGPHFNVVLGIRAIFDFLQLVGLVLLPMPELPDYVSAFVVFTQLLSSGNFLDLSPFSCLFEQLNANSKFVVQMLTVGGVLVVLLVVLLYGDVLFARRCESLRKRRWFLRLLAPFPSEEAYRHRLVELGLDEERALDGVVAVETFDVKQKTIREAYALIDNNRYAIAAVGQLPNSAVRESALVSLLAEQEELLRFLRQYEASVSRGGAPPPARDGGQVNTLRSPPSAAAALAARDAAATARLATRALQQPETERTTTLATAGSLDRGGGNNGGDGGGGSGAMTNADHTEMPAKAPPTPSAPAIAASTAVGAGGCADSAKTPAKETEVGGGVMGQPRLSPPTASTHTPPVPPSPSSSPSAAGVSSAATPAPSRLLLSPTNAGEDTEGKASAAGQRRGVDSGLDDGHDGDDEDDESATAKAALRPFEGVTPTPFSLFGAHEPFKPTTTPLHHLHPQLLPATERVAPQRQLAQTSSTMVWPRFRAQVIILCVTVYHYFYVTVVNYSFALVRCEQMTISVAGTSFGTLDDAVATQMHSSLVADRQVMCGTRTHASYRVAGIVLGSLYSTALPLGLLGLSFWHPRGPPGRVSGLAYVRECLIAFYGLSEAFLWWEACALLYKLAVILIRNLVASSNLVGFVICWTITVFLAFLVYLRPFYGVFSQSLNVIACLVLCALSMLQLLPLLRTTTMETIGSEVFIDLQPVQQASGVLVVALPCLALGVMLFLVWAIACSGRQWPQLGKVLFTLGGGLEVHNVLYFWRRRKTEAGTAADAGPGGVASLTSAGRSRPGSNAAVQFSFAGYNMRLVQQTRCTDAASDGDARDGEETTLADQIVQAVRGKASGKTNRRGGSSLWVSWGVVGGLIGVANHVYLLSRFIRESEAVATGEAAKVAAAAAAAPEKEASAHVDKTQESVVQSMAVMAHEAEGDLLTMCEHLRQLEHYVLQMEKALERRTES